MIHISAELEIQSDNGSISLSSNERGELNLELSDWNILKDLFHTWRKTKTINDRLSQKISNRINIFVKDQRVVSLDKGKLQRISILGSLKFLYSLLTG
jgi:hypothetical protein